MWGNNLTPPGARDPWLSASSNKLFTMIRSGNHSPKSPAQHVNSGRSLPAIPSTDGNTSASTANVVADESVTQELQADSSNLSYSPRDESDRSDDASSRLSIRIEQCSVELAETIDDPQPRAHPTSSKPENDVLGLLEFLAQLAPRASPKSKGTSSFPTVHEIPPEAPQTRQSHVRSRFASQKTQKSTGLTVVHLTLPTTEETTTTSSQESSSPRFVPGSPRASAESATSRVRYLRGTPRSHEGATAHRRSESQGGDQSGGADTSGLEQIARPSARRKLGKMETRRKMPRVMEAKKPAEEVKQLLEGWEELGRLADEIIAITSAGPLPLPTSTTQEPSNLEKPPVKD